MNTPLQALRHHVTGAIERGDASAIVGNPTTSERNTMSTKPLFFVELTDTYGGEANYGWVTRRLVRASTLMGAARKMAREAGLRVHCTDNYGDSARYDSASGATCMLISWAQGDEAERYLHVETI